MEYKIQQLLNSLSVLGSQLIDDLRGDLDYCDMPIKRAWNIGEAGPTDLAFWNRTEPLPETRAKVIITTRAAMTEVPLNRMLILTDRPRLLLAHMLRLFIDHDGYKKDHQTNGEFGSYSSIADTAVLRHCRIGSYCTIGHGVMIGGDGFAFEVDERDRSVHKLPHFGMVVLGNNVEVMAGTCIARGSFRDTVLEDDVKVDQLVHIAHNCHVGRGTLITAGSMIGGSATIGEFCWIAPETAVLNGIAIGNYSMTGMGAVAVKDVGENELVIGVPARKLRNRFPADHRLVSKT